MKPRHLFHLTGALLLSVMLDGALCSLGAIGAPSESDLAPLKKMINQGKEIRTLSADITETRHLKTLTRPLVSKGHLWFSSPSSFRWENGTSDQSILIGNAGGLFLIRHKEGTKSCRHLDSKMSAPMTPLGIPGLFPGDYDAFLRAFRVESIVVSGNRCHVKMTPLGSGVLHGVSSLQLDFDTENGRWTDLRIITKDGSSLDQKFSNVRINTSVPPELFDPGHETAPTIR